jgi:hypothetical protein
MDVESYGDAFLALVLAMALMWGAIFALAYAGRQFGGSARGYFVGFMIAWVATVLFFVLLTVWENSSR